MMIDQKSESVNERHTKLCVMIKGLRGEAIKGRKDSGIEQIWTEDQEYFDGIDDGNRGEKLLKPSTSDGRVTRERKVKKGTRSNVFFNITAKYVNSGAAHVADKIIRSDVSNYGLRPTPLPSLIQQSKDQTPATDSEGNPIQAPVLDERGQPQMQPHIVNGQPMMDQNGQPIMLPATKPVTKGDLAKQILQQAKDSADKAKTQIDDWLNECQINGQMRQLVHDAARIGSGVLKGPTPAMVKSSAVIQGENGVELVIDKKLAPQSRRISVWNLYPDPTCGQDIHRGKFTFEEDEINARLLGELKDDPSYIREAIDRVLEEGPKHPISGTSQRKKSWTKGKNELFQIWYYHGYLSPDDLEACGYQFEQPEGNDEGDVEEDVGLIGVGDGYVQAGPGGDFMPEPQPAPERKEQYPCIVVMVNDTIIKATVSPFDSGRFPYYVMRWQYRDDHWAGLGLARQMRTSQEGVNAGVRMMHDNAGAAGAPILIIDRSKIIPADGNWTVGPHKVYYTADDYDGSNIRDAMTWIITPNQQMDMMAIVQFWMRAAEEETGMPQLIQGMQADTQHTLGEAKLLNNNGSAMLRRVTNIFDDDVTKPHIGAYYEWLLLHGEDDSAKGDFQIDAMGSSVLIERDAHSQILPAMLQYSLNPAFGQDPELVYQEFLLSQHFDPEKLSLSEEKKAELAKRPPPEDPRITAAKIAAQTKIQVEQMDDKDQADHIVGQARLTMQQQQFDAAQADMDRALKKWEKTIEAQLEAARISGDKGMNDDNLKATLTKEAMGLRAQIALSMNNLRAKQVIKPPTEPSGRAPNGQAFQK